ncbi:CbiX/SirB N-terminal domain-containing protein [Cellulomonas sp. NPDC089187]|uniref:sirohydrochlorin chelatase n=1 Tax=Cellulomonas sp. NPDC089187 TaxID=3154970 RepID=UPI00341F17A2
MSAASTTQLVACAHGTRSVQGQQVIAALVADLRRLRPELTVHEAYVDVQEPAVATVVPERVPSVVVPLLLSTGVHVRYDIGAAVADRPSRAADPLGPDPRLADLLVRRLREAGADGADHVVLAAAGSSDPAAATAVREVLAALRARWDGPVEVAFGAAAQPSVPEAVQTAREAGAARVVVASYLLAPGHFHSALDRAGADLVTAPLGPDPVLAQIALDRFDHALLG